MVRASGYTQLVCAELVFRFGGFSSSLQDILCLLDPLFERLSIERTAFLSGHERTENLLSLRDGRIKRLLRFFIGDRVE